MLLKSLDYIFSLSKMCGSLFLFRPFQSVALAQERERELAQRDDLIRVLTQTRDQALAALQRHRLAIPTPLVTKEEQEQSYAYDAGDLQDLPPEEKIKSLTAQNDNLRAVIRQMRHDMENLSNELAARPPSVMVKGRDGEEGTSVPLTTGTTASKSHCFQALIGA